MECFIRASDKSSVAGTSLRLKEYRKVICNDPPIAHLVVLGHLSAIVVALSDHLLVLIRPWQTSCFANKLAHRVLRLLEDDSSESGELKWTHLIENSKLMNILGVGKKPTEYISIANWGDDALCIPYLALTQPDGTKKVWYGDIGKACGADWYHSLLKTGDDDYQPSCIWIDRNRSNGLRFQGLGLHISDFTATDERAAQYQDNPGLMCKAAPRFRMYEDMTRDDYIPFFNPPLEYVEKNLTDVDPAAVMNKDHWVLPQEGPNIKKSVIDADPAAKRKMLHRRQNSPNYGARAASNGTSVSNTPPLGNSTISNAIVVISTSPNHSAKQLCQSPTSWGHDFVSVPENLFCDMSTKKLWPVCDDTGKAGVTGGCFDKAKSGMRPFKGVLRGRDVRSGAGGVVPVKVYGKTLHWD